MDESSIRKNDWRMDAQSRSGKRQWCDRCMPSSCAYRHCLVPRHRTSKTNCRAGNNHVHQGSIEVRRPEERGAVPKCSCGFPPSQAVGACICASDRHSHNNEAAHRHACRTERTHGVPRRRTFHNNHPQRPAWQGSTHHNRRSVRPRFQRRVHSHLQSDELLPNHPRRHVHLQVTPNLV